MAIKFINKLSGVLDENSIKKLEAAAAMHQKYSNIDFKVISLENDKLTVKTTQNKSLSENYADSDTLRKRTKEMFDHFLPNMKINVQAVAYEMPKVDIVTPEWLNSTLLKKGIKIKDLVQDTGIDKTNLSAWINGVRPMSQPVKAMFFYYFLNKK